MTKGPAIVLLSGGQDSCTSLYWAKEQGYDPILALTISYGQRHVVELEAAKEIAERAGVAQECINVGSILKSTSPLVSDNAVGEYDSAEELPGGVEPTFVPGRNILFLTLAGNVAESIGAKTIITGVCEEDYGGYFDCRRIFIDAMEKALSEGIRGTQEYYKIETPLMFLTKKETVELAMKLDGCIGALALSHTCYKGQRPPCGKCHACHLRARGFEQAGVEDPLTISV